MSDRIVICPECSALWTVQTVADDQPHECPSCGGVFTPTADDVTSTDRGGVRGDTLAGLLDQADPSEVPPDA